MSASVTVWDELGPRLLRVEAALRNHLARVTCEAPAALSEAMAYSLFAPGKRLRPVLVVLACEAAGGALESALPAACALEMVHTYSLIHDDLPAMDDDDLRRGLPTCHKQFDEATAILAGDALLTGAFEVLAASYGPRTVAVSCVELAKGAGAAGMVGGQVLDLLAEGRLSEGRGQRAEDRGQRTEDRRQKTEGGDQVNSPTVVCPLTSDLLLSRLEAIHRAKTGALFRASLRMGVFAAQGERSAGVDLKTLASADDYAAAFGLLFQVTDDLLDVESTADKTGKRVGKDAARGKLTYPGLLGIEESRRRAADLGRQATTAAEQLGSPLLARLARYVVERDR